MGECSVTGICDSPQPAGGLLPQRPGMGLETWALARSVSTKISHGPFPLLESLFSTCKVKGLY